MSSHSSSNRLPDNYPLSCIDCCFFNMLKHKCVFNKVSDDNICTCVFFVFLPFPNIEEL